MDELSDAGPTDPSSDLTPRTSAASAARRGRRWPLTIFLVILVVAIGAILFKGLSDAALFFRNVDEAIAARDELGDKRFRLQGTVIDGSVRARGDVVAFTVAFNGEIIDVVHRGAPPELFTDGVPVVLEGNFVNGVPAGIEFDASRGSADGRYYFASDRILVRHDNQYEADNAERLDDAVQGGQVE